MKDDSFYLSQECPYCGGELVSVEIVNNGEAVVWRNCVECGKVSSMRRVSRGGSCVNRQGRCGPRDFFLHEIHKLIWS